MLQALRKCTTGISKRKAPSSREARADARDVRNALASALPQSEAKADTGPPTSPPTVHHGRATGLGLKGQARAVKRWVKDGSTKPISEED
tara:strand:- start:434 stop:703 length:270 start_codon:yes stop_codon:yes gene_type:complete